MLHPSPAALLLHETGVEIRFPVAAADRIQRGRADPSTPRPLEQGQATWDWNSKKEGIPFSYPICMNRQPKIWILWCVHCLKNNADWRMNFLRIFPFLHCIHYTRGGGTLLPVFPEMEQTRQVIFPEHLESINSEHIFHLRKSCLKCKN